jgi:hypothetical protein
LELDSRERGRERELGERRKMEGWEISLGYKEFQLCCAWENLRWMGVVDGVSEEGVEREEEGGSLLISKLQ